MLSALSPKDQKYTTDYVRECPYETTLKSLVTEFSLKKDKAMMKGIVVFCKRRLAFFKENGNKVIATSPYMSIQKVRAGENVEENIVIESADSECSTITIMVRKVEDQRDILVHIYNFFGNAFPDKEGNLREEKKKQIFEKLSSDMLEAVEEYACSTKRVPQKGGFLDAYLGYCDMFRQRPLEDVVWDLENLSESRHFDSKPFYKYASDPDKLKPLAMALSHNTFFTRLSLENFAIPKELSRPLCDMFRNNAALEVLNLSKCELSRDLFEQIMEALTENVGVAHFTELNFSNNPLEDRGLAALTGYISKCKGSLVFLDISNCRAGKSAMYNFFAALSGNDGLKKSLRTLMIAGNRCGEMGTGKLVEFIRDSSLAEIDASSASLDLAVLKAARSRALRRVNLSHNKVENPADLCTLLGNMHIKELSLASCGITAKALAQIIDRTGSKLLTLSVLDLSNNPLGCFGRKSEKRKVMIENLTKGINESSINELDMSAGSCPLREDIARFLLAMTRNRTVEYLNISGHELGSGNGVHISRLISANRTLISLFIDKNLLTLDDFIKINNALEKNQAIQNISIPIEDIAYDMKKNSGKVAYCEKLSNVVRSIKEKLSYNRTNPMSKSALDEYMEDFADIMSDCSYDDDDDVDDDDVNVGNTSKRKSGSCSSDGDDDDDGDADDDDEEMEFSVAIKGSMSKRTGMTVKTPRSTIRSKTFGSIKGSSSTYVERSTDIADYGEFPEIKFLRPAGMDPEKTREFLTSIKTAILDGDES